MNPPQDNDSETCAERALWLLLLIATAAVGLLCFWASGCATSVGHITDQKDIWVGQVMTNSYPGRKIAYPTDAADRTFFLEVSNDKTNWTNGPCAWVWHGSPGTNKTTIVPPFGWAYSRMKGIK